MSLLEKFKTNTVYCISDSDLTQLLCEVYELTIEDIEWRLNVEYTIYIVAKKTSEDVEDIIMKILHTDRWFSKGVWYLLTDLCNRDLIPEGVYAITYPASKLLS